MRRAQNEIVEDRWQHMKVLTLQGLVRYEMVPILIDLGLLECQTSHRRRVTGKNETICATCENTIAQDWIRNRARLSEDEADILDQKWEWLAAHREIARICRDRAIQDVTIETTRSEMIDGNEVKTLTVRKETRINVGLLRLRSELHDKMARFAGYDVTAPDNQHPLPRPLVVNELNAQGDREPKPN